MFKFINKKKQHILTLPLLNPKDLKPDKIAEYLQNDIPIVAVTDPIKQSQTNGRWNFEMLIGMEMNGLRPSLTLYRKEGPFLCKYRAYDFQGHPSLYFLLWDVFEMKNSNIFELCNGDLKDAFEIYHDDQKQTETQIFLPNDFTMQEGLNFFKNNPDQRSIHIGKNRIIKQNQESGAEI